MAKTTTTKTTRAPKATKAALKSTAKAIVAKRAAKPEADEDDEAPAPRSVVGAKYKAIYKQRENSNKGRNNADWLAQRLAALVLKEGKLDVAALQTLAKVNNAVADYGNRSKGWEGRMRMTIGLRLRPIVAAQGFLALPNGKKEKADPAFIAAWRK